MLRNLKRWAESMRSNSKARLLVMAAMAVLVQVVWAVQGLGRRM